MRKLDVWNACYPIRVSSVNCRWGEKKRWSVLSAIVFSIEFVIQVRKKQIQLLYHSNVYLNASQYIYIIDSGISQADLRYYSRHGMVVFFSSACHGKKNLQVLRRLVDEKNLQIFSIRHAPTKARSSHGPLHLLRPAARMIMSARSILRRLHLLQSTVEMCVRIHHEIY